MSSGTTPSFFAFILNSSSFTFQLVHQSGSESLDLFGRSNRKEGNLGKSLSFEFSKADSSDNLGVVS